MLPRAQVPQGVIFHHYVAALRYRLKCVFSYLAECLPWAFTPNITPLVDFKVAANTLSIMMLKTLAVSPEKIYLISSNQFEQLMTAAQTSECEKATTDFPSMLRQNKLIVVSLTIRLATRRHADDLVEQSNALTLQQSLTYTFLKRGAKRFREYALSHTLHQLCSSSHPRRRNPETLRVVLR